MRWAFWRRRRAAPDGGSPEPLPLPDDVGLPTRPSPPPAPRRGRDENAEPAPGARPSPFSGATPDPGGWVSSGLPADGPREPAAPSALDGDAEARCRAAVVDAVGAVLAGDRSALDAALAPADAAPATRAFATCAAGQALAARLPELSGVSGAAMFDEDEDDLRRAYAELLAQRSESTRARVAPDVPRELLLHVAQVCARGGSTADDPAPSADWPVSALSGTAAQQLRAVCVLLAQTTRDGGAGPGALPAELRRTTC